MFPCHDACFYVANVELVDLSSALEVELSLLSEDFMLFNHPFSNSSHRRFDEVVLGGTFDHFHNGHKALLTAGLLFAESRVVVGVTGDELLKTKKNRESIEDIDTRKNHVKQFVESIQDRVELELCVIQDPFGPTIVRDSLKAIVVSSETIKGARMINEKRKQRNMEPLFVIVVMRSNVHTLSSTFVRKTMEQNTLEAKSRKKGSLIKKPKRRAKTFRTASLQSLKFSIRPGFPTVHGGKKKFLS